MGLVKTALVLREWRHAARFEAAARDPQRAQARVLARLLAEQRETAFGQEHRFAALASPADYRAAVPLRDYEAFRPHVRRILQGEARVLTAAPPVMFTTTSGTTGEPKLIPVTVAWREQLAKLNRLWLLRAVRDHPGCLDGKILLVASPAVEGYTEGGLPFGAMSGVIARRMPWVVRRQAAVPYAVCLLDDYQARYFLTMRLAAAVPVSILGTPNPSTLIRLAETMRDRGAEMIRAIHDGTLGIGDPRWSSVIDDDERRQASAALAAAARPDRPRARALEALVDQHGQLLPRHVWPGLRLVGCWLGGSAGIQARALARFFGPAPLRDVGLVASEGRMTIPISDGTPAGVLALHRTFFEFIPEDRIDAADPPVRLAHELEVGRRYYIVPSGGNGLYRYDINDIVEVTGHHHRAPLVAFVRKGRDMVSITGEKLHLNQIQAGVRAAEGETGTEVWQMAFIPDVEGSRYHLLLETAGAAPPPAVDPVFLQSFDRAVAAANQEYAQKRASGRLGPPRLHWMRSGWSEAASRAELDRGRRDFQFKWQVIRDRWDDASRRAVTRSADAELRSPLPGPRQGG